MSVSRLELLFTRNKKFILFLEGSGNERRNISEEVKTVCSKEINTVNYIPIVLSLFKQPENVNDIFRLRCLEDLGYSEERYEKLCSEGKVLLIIFDYEELDDLSWLRDQLREWNGPSWDRLKVVVFCSELHCRLKEGSHYQSSFYPIESGTVKRSWFAEIKDQLLSHEEQTSIIEHYCAEESTEWDLDTYVWYSNQVPGLKDLLVRRLFLSLFLEELPGHFKPSSKDARKITRANVRNIYQHLIDGWIVRHSQSEDIDKEQSIALASDIRELSVVLVKVMSEFKPKKTHIKRSELLRLIEKSVNKKRVERAIRLCPICINEQDEFEFINPVIQGLFEKSPVANRRNLFEKGVSLLEESDDGSELALLSRTVLSDGVVGGLSQKILDGDEQAAERYLGYVKASAKDERLAMASVNSGTIMVRGGVNLSGENFSAVKFSAFDSVQREQVGADLSGGIFDSVNFKGVDFSEVKLWKAWMHNSDISGGNLLGVDFGSLPSLEYDGPVTDISIINYNNNNFLAVSSGRKVFVYDRFPDTLLFDEPRICSGYQGEVLGVAIVIVEFKNYFIVCDNKNTIYLSSSFVTVEDKYALNRNIKSLVSFENNLGAVLLSTTDGCIYYVSVSIEGKNPKLSVSFLLKRSGLLEAPFCLVACEEKYFFTDGKNIHVGEYKKILHTYTHQIDLVLCAYASKSSQIIAVDEMGNIIIWQESDVASKFVVKIDQAISYLLVESNGKYVFALSKEGMVYVIRLSDCKLISSFYSCQGEVFAVSLWGDHLITGSVTGLVRFRPLKNVRLSGQKSLVKSQIVNMAYDPHTRSFVTVSLDDNLHVFSVLDRCFNYIDSFHSNAWSVAISNNGKYIAFGLEKGAVQIWDVTTRVLCAEWKAHDGVVTGIHWSSDDRIITSGADGFIYLWLNIKRLSNESYHPQDNQIVLYQSSIHQGSVWCLRGNADGSRVYAGLQDGSVTTIDTTQENPISTSNKVHMSAVFQLAISDNGSSLMSCSVGGEVCIWSVNKGSLDVNNVHKSSHDNLTSASYLGGQNYITAGVDGQVCLWDAKSKGVTNYQFSLGIICLVVINSSEVLCFCSDFTLQYWRYVDAKKTWVLWAISGSNDLNLNNLNWNGVQNYSLVNSRLLKQQHHRPVDSKTYSRLLKKIYFASEHNFMQVKALRSAILNGDVGLVEGLLESVDVNVLDEEGNSLVLFAASIGSVEMVSLLIAKQADIEQANHDNMTPLLTSILFGEDQVVALLLENDADPNRRIENGHTPLTLAASLGNLNVVRLVLACNVDVDQLGKLNHTALRYASVKGYVEVVRVLIEHKAKLDFSHDGRVSPLCVASSCGHLEVVKLLKESGASINMGAMVGVTALYMAALKGHVDIVRYLLSVETDPNLPVENGFLPLQVASQAGHLDVVILLIEKGASVNQADKAGNTALFFACKAGKVQVVEYLLSVEADPNKFTDAGPLGIASEMGFLDVVRCLVKGGAKVNQISSRGFSALFIAIELSHNDIVEYLLLNGADVHLSGEYGLFPLYIASMVGNFDAVKLLLLHDADVNQKTDKGFTALYIAAARGHRRVVEHLLSEKANVHMAGDDGSAPLHAASQNGRLEIVKLLVRKEASVKQTTEKGISALYLAVKNNHYDIAEYLLLNGADVDVAGDDGITPLHLASQNGNVKMVELLLKHKADVDKANRVGCTPVYFAARNGHRRVVSLLIAEGADVNAPNSTGVTPLYAAAENGHGEVVWELLSGGAKTDLERSSDKSAFWGAVKGGHFGNVEKVYSSEGVVQGKYRGFSALYIASKKGYIDVVEGLLKKGANVNNADNNYGYTALYAAASEGHLEIMQMLLSAGADPTLSSDNGTPLYIAVKNGHYKVAEYLISIGMDVNQATWDGYTPLFRAVQNGNRKMVDLLLANGADVNIAARKCIIRLFNDDTIIRTRLYQEVMDIGSIDHDATALSNINPNDRLAIEKHCGTTPLMIAASKGYLDLVLLLLKNGAEINATSMRGVTALYAAVINEHDDVSSQLVSAGAKVNIKDENGYSPAYIAEQNHHKLTGQEEDGDHIKSDALQGQGLFSHKELKTSFGGVDDKTPERQIEEMQMFYAQELSRKEIDEEEGEEGEDDDEYELMEMLAGSDEAEGDSEESWDSRYFESGESSNGQSNSI